MRNLKSIALIAVLALGNTAFAETATTTDYNNANMTVTASGSTGQAVSFTIPDSTIDIDTAKLRPGASYTITIPVTNSTTDRTMTITAAATKGGTLSDTLYTLTPTNETLANLAAGASGDMTYTLTISNTVTTAAMSSKTLSITVALSAVGTN